MTQTTNTQTALVPKLPKSIDGLPAEGAVQKMRDVLRNTAASLELLQTAKTLAGSLRAESSAKLDDLDQARPALLLEGSDPALEAHDSLAGAARRLNDRAEALDDALTNRIADKIDQDAEELRIKEYHAANEACAAAEEAIRTALPKIKAEAIALIKTVNEARVLIRKVDANMPAGKSPVRDPETFRWTGPESSPIVMEETVDLWCVGEPTIRPLDERDQAEVQSTDGRRGTFKTQNGRVDVEKLTFVKVTSTTPARFVSAIFRPIAEELCIPAADNYDAPWPAVPSYEPGEVAKHLARFERFQPPVPAPPSVNVKFVRKDLWEQHKAQQPKATSAAL